MYAVRFLQIIHSSSSLQVQLAFSTSFVKQLLSSTNSLALLSSSGCVQKRCIATFYLASRLIQVDPKQNRKRFDIYSLILWLIPLLIVSICVILKYNNTTADIINYGRENGIGSSSCWINDFNLICCSLLCLSRRNKGKDSARDNNPPSIIYSLFY